MTTVLSALIETQMFGDAEPATPAFRSSSSSSLHAEINPPAPTEKVIPAAFCRKRRLVNACELSTGEVVDLLIRITRNGLLDGLNYHRIGAASAQISAHRVDDFLSARVGIFSQQARRAHDLT